MSPADQDDITEVRSNEVFSEFIDQEWLDATREEAIDPQRPVVDPHHHLWDPPLPAYPAEALLADLDAGHDVRATVYLETHEHWYEDGPLHLRAAGETAHAAAVGERVSTSDRQVAAGIIGHCDLTAGREAEELLDAHIEAGNGRFKGVRANLFWDPVVDVAGQEMVQDLADDPAFRAGFSQLSARDLVVDVFAYYTNVDSVERLVRDFPGTRIVLNHCGGPLGREPYSLDAAASFADWRDSVRRLGRYPNARMKLGGLVNPFFGPLIPADLRGEPAAPTSERLAELMRPWIAECIDAFGPDRCMFESNFPADKPGVSYPVLWNAFKRLSHEYASAEQDAMLAGTAAEFYGLSITS